MGESYQHHQQQMSTRLGGGLRRGGAGGGGGGEIVEVQGGHIVRATGRKDRHSKVCTAKGPRDRRVRLSAQTAIQFYDVQDRLGYDRPSKAVDWLIKKAKAAIDELAELPAWKPTTGNVVSLEQTHKQEEENVQENLLDNNTQGVHHRDVMDAMAGPSSKRALTMVGSENQVQNASNPTTVSSSSFLPPSLDSDSIADTIKSFFPMGASTEPNTSAMQFQSFPPPENLLSRTSSRSQDLRLSLQSFQDPLMLHHHRHHHQHHHNPTSQEQQQVHVQSQSGFFSGNTAVQLGFDGGGGGGGASSAWSEHHHHPTHQQSTELARFQRLPSWSAGADTVSPGTTSGGAAAAATGVGGLYMYNPAPGASMLQPLFGQNQFFSSQRGPLQSSNTPSVRAWMDPSAMAMTSTDHHHGHQHHPQAMLLNYQPSSISGIGFASNVGGFSGFHIPSRIQGDEEEHDGISDKPSSASSDSRH